MLSTNTTWKSGKFYRNLSWPSATGQRLELMAATAHRTFYVIAIHTKNPTSIRSSLCITIDPDTGLIAQTKTYQNTAHISITQSEEDGTLVHSSMSETPPGKYDVVVFSSR